MHSGTVAWWQEARWQGGIVAQWHGGKEARWPSGKEAGRQGDQVV